MTTNNRSYSELMSIRDYLERFEYLKLDGRVGEITFGYERYLNQTLYRSEEWKRFRRDIILRDNGCDLACEGFEIYGKIMVHHINPITIDDVARRSKKVFDPENVICCSMNTHNAIHYGDSGLLLAGPITRTPYDTCPWRK